MNKTHMERWFATTGRKTCASLIQTRGMPNGNAVPWGEGCCATTVSRVNLAQIS